MSSANTTIEWTEKTWNPVRGCSLISPGCTNCYAMELAHRFSGEGKPYEGLTKKRVSLGPVWTGEVRKIEDALAEPLGWRKPTTVFVNSMSDLFHELVDDHFIAATLGIMSATPRHTYQILTKRASRLPRFFAWLAAHPHLRKLGPLGDHAAGVGHITGRAGDTFNQIYREGGNRCTNPSWPLANVWLGVSVEDRKHGVPRIKELQRTPAALRFLSIEPLLEDLGEIDLSGIHWVIVGGESGHNARPCDLAWIRSIVTQCKAASVPVFVKQVGARPVDSSRAAVYQPCRHEGKPAIRTTVYAADAPEVAQARVDARDERLHLAAPQVQHPLYLREHFRYADAKGGDMAEWPADLRVREMPEARS